MLSPVTPAVTVTVPPTPIDNPSWPHTFKLKMTEHSSLRVCEGVLSLAELCLTSSLVFASSGSILPIHGSSAPGPTLPGAHPQPSSESPGSGWGSGVSSGSSAPPALPSGSLKPKAEKEPSKGGGGGAGVLAGDMVHTKAGVGECGCLQNCLWLSWLQLRGSGGSIGVGSEGLMPC